MALLSRVQLLNIVEIQLNNIPFSEILDTAMEVGTNSSNRICSNKTQPWWC